MAESAAPVTVLDNPDMSRYEAFVGDALAGFVTYQMRPGVAVLVHTEVNAEFEGHGVGGRLASAVLEDVRARGLKVSPLCPFVRSYIERHPEFADLVAGRDSRPGT